MLFSMKKTVKFIESIFDILYLLTILILACFLLFSPAFTGVLQMKFGFLALLLAFGDAFHLIPRIRAMWDATASNYDFILGLGKMVSSVTMTLFYLGLWHIGTITYDINNTLFNAIVIGLAIIRIIICLLPQNKWMNPNTSSNIYIWRNIPLLLLGIFVMLLFIFGSKETASGHAAIWLPILLSFFFYIPVILFSQKNPKIYILMLPKSCAYIAIIFAGFSFFAA